MKRLYKCYSILLSLTSKSAIEIIISQYYAIIKCGDLIALKYLITDGEISFQSKILEGFNLLDLILYALRMSWFITKAEAALSII